ncbi:hypothetical protein [Psychrobacillus sp. L3]|uniref:hypothetical protein n=1 Tax=Psychrobacillus sp. L3 TaxID=3236891 RepID=UPI0036F27BA6
MFVGILMIIMGISHLKKKDFFIGKGTEAFIGKDKFPSFQKGLVLPYFLTGTIIFCMGIVENIAILQTSIYITLYIIVGIIPVVLLIANNKKHTGRYFFWVKSN